jgi:hypothetical protein
VLKHVMNALFGDEPPPPPIVGGAWAPTSAQQAAAAAFYARHPMPSMPKPDPPYHAAVPSGAAKQPSGVALSPSALAQLATPQNLSAGFNVAKNAFSSLTSPSFDASASMNVSDTASSGGATDVMEGEMNGDHYTTFTVEENVTGPEDPFGVLGNPPGSFGEEHWEEDNYLESPFGPTAPSAVEYHYPDGGAFGPTHAPGDFGLEFDGDADCEYAMRG